MNGVCHLNKSQSTSCFCLFFFFKQKTAYEMRISDWSSDVCSSDLAAELVQQLSLRRDTNQRQCDQHDAANATKAAMAVHGTSPPSLITRRSTRCHQAHLAS